MHRKTTRGCQTNKISIVTKIKMVCERQQENTSTCMKRQKRISKLSNENQRTQQTKNLIARPIARQQDHRDRFEEAFEPSFQGRPRIFGTSKNARIWFKSASGTISKFSLTCQNLTRFGTRCSKSTAICRL